MSHYCTDHVMHSSWRRSSHAAAAQQIREFMISGDTWLPNCVQLALAQVMTINVHIISHSCCSDEQVHIILLSIVHKASTMNGIHPKLVSCKEVLIKGSMSRVDCCTPPRLLTKLSTSGLWQGRCCCCPIPFHAVLACHLRQAGTCLEQIL